MGRTDLRPDITKEVLEEYIRKGNSQNRIAITLGTTQSTIFNKLKKYGLQVQKTRPSNYDEKALIKQLQNGWTTEQIARYFGVCTGTVGSWISKNKLGKYRKASPKKFDTKLCSTCIYGTGKKTDMDATFKYGIKVCMVGYGSCKRTVLGYPIGHGWYNLEEAQYYAEDSIIAWMHLPEPYKED